MTGFYRTDLLRESIAHALAEIDIDGFQGHKMGDRILALVEQFLAEGPFKAYRIGGDQFGVVGCDSEDAGREIQVAVKLLCERQLDLRVTISGGGIGVPDDSLTGDPETVKVVYATAMDLLGLAKQHGRDRIYWLVSEPSDSVDMTILTLRFYRELALVNSARARQMEVESRIDVLTGLFNRRGFEDVFRRLVDASQRNRNPLALIYMDSDSLKRINDSDGHAAGDRFIVDLSGILRDVVRSSDCVFRWGADEFAAVLENSTVETAGSLAERVRDAVQSRTKGTMSIGIYCGVPDDTDTPVRVADRAMYAAKRQGGNRIQFGEVDPADDAADSP